MPTLSEWQNYTFSASRDEIIGVSAIIRERRIAVKRAKRPYGFDSPVRQRLCVCFFFAGAKIYKSDMVFDLPQAYALTS